MLVIDTPRNILYLAEAARFAGGNDAAFRLRLRQEAARFYLELKELEPSAGQYAEAASFMSDISGLALTPQHARDLLLLYPHARIRLAAFRSSQDLEVRESLAFALAHFLLGCRWPAANDRVDGERFLDLLQEQARALGFPCHDEGPAVSYTAGPFANDHEALLASLGGATS
ncbi:hypothetical protein [Halomonas mongoliensis]